MESLQIPGPAPPGPSRHSATSRPQSVSPSSAPSAPSAQPASRKRASHSVTSSTHPEEQQQQLQQQLQPPYRDIYSHPAAIQYAATHPRRAIPKFGPYLLLQTLGEGEFGKVKLGLHTGWAEEVAVKLIKRHNIDSAVRMSKVEREIEVLRMLKHPNIVRLYDVIETDKYIGIILDYASGGELFDHILAHRFLKEKDACRLFAQLISGVWYIHQRKIVHRDLKLENLLLDRNRNVIITDFGFANRFEHRSDDLMQTSCGSPCYAAPELVISEGAYVGSAVDIWSCGVILYAMLAGYLPFDDDPANPDGDNINLLYKYIVNTPLSFPDYISREARDLLSIMLQPDPQRRADLSLVMQHPWLAPYAYIFDKTVEDLETSAIELHKAKRQAYQRQMRSAAQAPADTKVSRSQSAKNDVFPHASVAVAPRSHPHAPEDQTLYETSADLAAASQAQAQTRRGYTSTIVMPTQPSGYVDDDPFAQHPAGPAPGSIPIASTSAEQQQLQQAPSARKDQLPPIPPQAMAVNGTSSVRSKAARDMRHTIQVEYGQPEPSAIPPTPKRDETPRKEPKPSQDLPPSPPLPQPTSPPLQALSPSTPQQQQREKPRRSSLTGPRPPPTSPPLVLPPTHTPPKIEPPLVTINAASPPATPLPQDEKGPYNLASITSSSSSKRGKHNRGISIDKMGLGKIFGIPSPSEATNLPSQAARAPSEGSAANSLYSTISKISGSTSRRPSTLQVAPSSSPSISPTVEASATQTSLLSPDNGKKNRRSTLSVMVEPIARTIKVRPGRNSTRGSETPAREKESSRERSDRQSRSVLPVSASEREKVSRAPDSVGRGMQASTSKARKVMQWFRSRSKGRSLGDDGETSSPVNGRPSVRNAFAVNESSTSINAKQLFPGGVVEEYTQVPSRMGPPHPQRTVSTGAEGAPTGPSFAELVRRHVAPPKGIIRTHHGAVNQATVTTRPPIDVMRHVREVLVGMGVDVQVESDYKYRCVRAKRRRAPPAPSGFGLGLREPGLAAFTLIGSAASNGVDKRGLPVPSPSSFSGATGSKFRGLLMRRQSSQVSGETEAPSPDIAISPSELSAETVYGDPTQDQGDEVRFYVELTKLDGLKDTYSIDIRRLKGNLRSYKFLYDCITERLDLQR